MAVVCVCVNQYNYIVSFTGHFKHIHRLLSTTVKIFCLSYNIIIANTHI